MGVGGCFFGFGVSHRSMWWQRRRAAFVDPAPTNRQRFSIVNCGLQTASLSLVLIPHPFKFSLDNFAGNC